jgi:hypothetical protein
LYHSRVAPSHPSPYIKVSPLWACPIAGEINGDKSLWKSLPEPTLLLLFQDWFDEAVKTEINDPDAIALASVDA